MNSRYNLYLIIRMSWMLYLIVTSFCLLNIYCSRNLIPVYEWCHILPTFDEAPLQNLFCYLLPVRWIGLFLNALEHRYSWRPIWYIVDNQYDISDDQYGIADDLYSIAHDQYGIAHNQYGISDDQYGTANDL